MNRLAVILKLHHILLLTGLSGIIAIETKPTAVAYNYKGIFGVLWKGVWMSFVSLVVT